MRVAIMAWYGPKFAGVWNYYLNMARVLRAHAPHFQVCIFHAPGLDAKHRAEIEAATGEPGRELAVASRLADLLALAGFHDRSFARLCREARIDVVFEQARFLGRKFPTAVLPWIGDLQHRALPHYFTRLHRLQRDVGFYAQTKFRDHVVVSSQSAREDLLRFIPRPHAKVHVVPFALRLTEEVTEAKIARAREVHGLEEPYLFLPNQLWRHKNHAAAFKALDILARRGRRLTLAISGQPHDYRHPEYSEEIGRLIEQLDIKPQLRWLGVVPYSDLLCLTAGATALLNPSFFEGWSTTVEEAKTLGTPMVLSGIDVHREQAGDQAVFFLPNDAEAFADAIEQVVEGPHPDRAAARAVAKEKNMADQKIYAARLATALEAAAASHRA